MQRKTYLARQLRKNSTRQELKFWQIVRNRNFYGYLFRRQYPIGDYIVDFICRAKKIIIEIDGGQHGEALVSESDLLRTSYLESKGYKVYRFWNNDIDSNMVGVFEKLKEIFEVSDSM